jgi:uncharacterized protein with HEPN domain
MRRDLLVYLIHIQDALEELAIFIAGKKLADYQKEALLRRGVEREFSIMGEAMRRILHHFPETKSRVDHARSIANFRNVIMHEYDELDDVEVWKIATHSAPLLKQQIDEWIHELERDS